MKNFVQSFEEFTNESISGLKRSVEIGFLFKDFNKKWRGKTPDDTAFTELSKTLLDYFNNTNTPENIESGVDFLKMNWDDYGKFDKREWNSITTYFWSK